MRIRRPKKAGQARRSSWLSGLRLWLVVAALAVVALLVVREASESGLGADLARRVFGVRDLSERVAALDRAVDAALVEMGAYDIKAETETRTEGRTTWPHWIKAGRLPAGADLIRCNLEVTEAVRSEGGDVLLVRERAPDWRGGRTLDMKVGIGGRETHEVVLRETPGEPPERPAGAPRIAIVIDDLGYGDSRGLREVLALEDAVTVAVVPASPASGEAAEAARAAGKEVILHLPMQPEGYPGVKPGEGALLVDQTAEELRALVSGALDDVPGAVGVNNHMGSAFTADRTGMRAVMRELGRRGLFFFDSMTTARSVGADEARRAGVPVVRNSMFLDSGLDETGRVDVASQLRDLEALARSRGYASAIGHPRRETLATLRREMPAMKERGIEFVFLSDLIRGEVRP
jgi:polysaccharide deacetylase 2 family uncharacterized protein YibQ